MDGRSFPRRTLILSLLALAAAAAPVWAGNDTWTVAGQPSGGVVAKVMVAAPSSSSTVYAVAWTGLFKSTDGGATWNQSLSTLLEDLRDVAVAPENPTTLYAVTQAVESGNAWTSTDGGTTWTAANNGLPTLSADDPGMDSLSHVAVDPVTDTTAYVSTLNNGIYKTTDGGADWAAANSGITDLLFNGSYVNNIVIDPTNTQVVYLSEQVDVGGGLPGTTSLAGVYVSTNGGGNWTQQTGLPAGTSIQDLVMDPSNHLHLLAVGFSNIYSTTDGGAHWAALAGTVPEPTTIAIDPYNPTHIMVGTFANGTYVSTNSGVSFSPLVSGDQSTVYSVAFDPATQGNIYRGVGYYGLFKSGDGGSTWAESDTGIYGIVVSQMFMDGSGNIFIASDGTGVLESTDQGASWNQMNNGMQLAPYQALGVDDLVEDPEQAQTLYAATGDGLFKSVDGAADWTAINNGITDPITTAVTVDPENSLALYVGTQTKGLFKSVDGGVSWQPASNGITDPNVISIAVSPSNSNLVLAGTWGHGLFISIDGGATWNSASNAYATEGVWAIAFDPKNPNTVYATPTNESMIKSTDGGMTWASSNTGLFGSGSFYTSIQIDSSNTSIIYVSPIIGLGDVYVSADAGATWTALVNGLPAQTQEESAVTAHRLTMGMASPSKLAQARQMAASRTLASGGTPVSIGAVALDPHSTKVYGADKQGQIYVYDDLNPPSSSSGSSSGGSGGSTGGGTTGGGTSGSSGGGGAFSLFAGLLLGLGLLRRRRLG